MCSTRVKETWEWYEMNRQSETYREYLDMSVGVMKD